MKKIILIFLCLYLITGNSFTHLKNIIFPHTELKEAPTLSIQSLYQQILSLENTYNDKLLTAHGINPLDLKEKLENITGDTEKEEFKKNYIMENGNLTEKQYQDIFVHPLMKITDSSSTVNDIENTYQAIKDKVIYIENLINTLNQ